MQGFLQPQSSPTLTLVTGFNKPPYVVIHSTPLISSAQMVECRFHSPMSSYLIMTRNHNPFSLRSKSDNSPWGIFSLSATFKQYPIPYKETESLTSECAELLIDIPAGLLALSRYSPNCRSLSSSYSAATK